ncbi:MAG: aldo/keto reductase, partial [Nanoarchaeota archaeon]|nr:aldo/keto reductase [Nanoarchaeota archaeon]
MEYIKLKNGYQMPVIGLGTWKMKGSECINAVKTALKVGYTHIDTAEIYNNEDAVGKAIKDSDRSKLFITSKAFHDHLHHDDVIKACNGSLKALGTDYIDLYLMHWPNKDVPMKETLTAMKELLDAEKIKSFGVSNFTIAHLKEALALDIIPINMNQVEFHPYINQKELLDFCKKNRIVITAYCPNAHGEVIDDEVLQDISKEYSKTAAQVSQRWLLQKGMIVIAKSKSEEHIKENLDMFSWKLSDKDMKKIDGLHRDYRICDY